MPTSAPKDCPLCFPERENVLWHDASCRVIRIDDPDYPGYCRLMGASKNLAPPAAW